MLWVFRYRLAESKTLHVDYDERARHVLMYLDAFACADLFRKTAQRRCVAKLSLLRCCSLSLLLLAEPIGSLGV